MFRPILTASAVLVLAACAGNQGPQDIQIGVGGGEPVRLAAGPHQPSQAERKAIQNVVAKAAPGASIGTLVARRDDNGVVAVCGRSSAGAPFFGILREQSGEPGFSLAGIGLTEPEARAVSKICAERQLTV